MTDQSIILFTTCVDIGNQTSGIIFMIEILLILAILNHRIMILIILVFRIVKDIQKAMSLEQE